MRKIAFFVVEYLFTPEQTYHKNGERVESNTCGDRAKDETQQHLLKPYDTCRTCQLWREDQTANETRQRLLKPYGMIRFMPYQGVHYHPGSRWELQFCCSYKVFVLPMCRPLSHKFIELFVRARKVKSTPIHFAYALAVGP